MMQDYIDNFLSLHKLKGNGEIESSIFNLVNLFPQPDSDCTELKSLTLET
jgi:hypothetical protein